MSLVHQESQVSVTKLPPSHSVPLQDTLKRILLTPLATHTFAQIIDDLPTRDDDRYFPIYSMEIRNNSQPSLEAMTAAANFLKDSIESNTRIDPALFQHYRCASIPGLEFYFRLLEVLAIVIHDLAAQLWEESKRRRDGGKISQEKIDKDLKERPTNFMHEDYSDWEQYPNGVADMVGYWAEFWIFGGVVLFDRGESGTGCKRVFLHPVGRFKIFQLSESQVEQFVAFTRRGGESAEGGSALVPFPLNADKYASRVDPFDAMKLNIYRDKYERKVLDESSRQCVSRLSDDPMMMDAMKDLRKCGII